MTVSSCIVVTGANKGIGRALVERLLAERPDTLVYLGSRDQPRGDETRRAILAAEPAWEARLQVLRIDVCDESSITAAAAAVAAHGLPLRAVVNNAGVWGTPRITYKTNVLGAARVTDAFLPALRAFAASHAGGDGHARVVNVSSGVSPMFVAKCAPVRKAWFASKVVPTRTEVAAAAASYFDLLERYEQAQGKASAAGGAADADAAAAAAAAAAALVADGYPAPDAQSAYFASKAFLTADTRALAAELEAEGSAAGAGVAADVSGSRSAVAGSDAGSLRAIACSPGMIATDMVAPFFASSGKTPEEAGALPPAAATRVLFHLLFAPEAHNGWFYGSDAKRSPLDAYRSPGSPEYEGEV